MIDPNVAARLLQAEQRLASYLQAEQRILESQEYVVGDGGTGRRNRRAELETVRDAITQINSEIAQLRAASQGTRRVFYINPL